MTLHPRGIRAVLFDRDGTLALDVPDNGDPALVRPMPHARESITRLRDAGVAVGLVSNQSGIGRGLLSDAQVRAVNHRLEKLIGAFDVWQYCAHTPEDGCLCRMPQPGMIRHACRLIGVVPGQTVVIGDWSAMQAARAAGAPGVLVPTPTTRPQELFAADLVAPDLRAAVDLVLTEVVMPAIVMGGVA